MKKRLLAATMGLVITASAANAAVTLNVGALHLRDNLGNLAPLNTVGLWIVDTATNGFTTGTLNPGFSIAVGSYWAGSDDLIVSKLNIAATEEPGYLSMDLIGYTYVPPIYSGQRFGIVWLVNQTLADDIARPGWYGFFSDWQGTYSNPWILPPDPTTFLQYDMTTVSAGGSVPDSMGWAMHRIIPEPSTALLVGAGLLGLAAIRRRR